MIVLIVIVSVGVIVLIVYIAVECGKDKSTDDEVESEVA